MSSPRLDISSAQREVLAVVYRYFSVDGRWPLTRVLRRDLKHLGYLESLVANLGPEVLVCRFDLDDAAATCRLGPEGLALVPEAQRHRDLVVAAARYLADRYCGSHERVTLLSASELFVHLGVGETEFRALCELVRYDDLIAANYYECTPHACSIAGYPDIELSDALVGMTTVVDYADFLARRREYRRARVQLLVGPFASSTSGMEVTSSEAHSTVMRWLEHEARTRGRFWAVLATVAGLLLALLALWGAA